MNRKFILIVLALSVALSVSACGGETVSTEPLFDESQVATYPGRIVVRYGNQSQTIYPETVSWAYAINAEEWCSVVSEAPQPIDQDFDEKFTHEGTEVPLVISFPGKSQPNGVAYLHRFSNSLWAPNENNEDMKLKDALERELDYNDFEECGYQVSNANGYVVKYISTDTAGYIYEIKIAWDTENYRGTATYSFMIGE